MNCHRQGRDSEECRQATIAVWKEIGRLAFFGIVVGGCAAFAFVMFSKWVGQ